MILEPVGDITDSPASLAALWVFALTPECLSVAWTLADPSLRTHLATAFAFDRETIGGGRSAIVRVLGEADAPDANSWQLFACETAERLAPVVPLCDRDRLRAYTSHGKVGDDDGAYVFLAAAPHAAWVGRLGDLHGTGISLRRGDDGWRVVNLEAGPCIHDVDLIVTMMACHSDN